MFRRTKIKLEKKDKGPTDNDDQKSVKNELTEKYRKILGKKKNQESDASSLQSDQNDSVTEIDKKTKTVQTSQSENEKISSLIQLIKSADKKILAPVLDVSTGIFTFPQLSEIGEDPNNVQFLENLTSDSIDILEKTVYERITVCPQHPDSLQVNVRLYCPKCNSIDIEKLHLFEHKVCGFISETKSFGIANSVMVCPSCKKQIKEKKTEIRIPAMWYNCLSCREKFDDVIMKMYCRKFDHSFDTNMAGTVSIPGYILKDSQSTSSYDPSLISHIKQLLQEHKFISEENHSLKGKSGHFHNIDLIATNTNTDTLFLFVLQSDNTLDESKINSKIIQVLDCNPTKTIIVGKLSDKAKSLASRYDISVIDSFEKSEVLSTLETILTDTFTTEKLAIDNHQLGINELAENEIIEEEKLENNNQQLSINELAENEIFEEEKLAKTEKLEVENGDSQRKLEEERLAERKKHGEERLAERKKLEEERLDAEKIEAERLGAELQAEKQRLEKEMESSTRKLKDEIQFDKQKLEEEKEKLAEERRDSERIKAEGLAERKRLEEEKKKVERIEAERLAERKKLESEILSERKRSKSERESDRKRLEEERFADQLKLKAEKQRLENERKKVEKLEAERQSLEQERKNAELLVAEKFEVEEKRKETDIKQAAKKEKILKKLEETENQLRALKSSFDSDDEGEE